MWEPRRVVRCIHEMVNSNTSEEESSVKPIKIAKLNMGYPSMYGCQFMVASENITKSAPHPERWRREHQPLGAGNRPERSDSQSPCKQRSKGNSSLLEREGQGPGLYTAQPTRLKQGRYDGTGHTAIPTSSRRDRQRGA